MSIQDNLYIFLVHHKDLGDNLIFALCCTHLSPIHVVALSCKIQIDKMCSQVVQIKGIIFNNPVSWE